MNLSDSLLKSLGVNPDELKSRMGEIAAEYAGFKSGFRNAMAHFEKRLDVIEKNQHHILALLQDSAIPNLEDAHATSE